MKYPGTTDADDMFSNTRMSFGDHIEELRLHLFRAIFGLVVAIGLCLILDGIGWAVGRDWIGISVPVMKFMEKPVEDGLVVFYDNRLAKVKHKLEIGGLVPANEHTAFAQITLWKPKEGDNQHQPVTQEEMD